MFVLLQLWHRTFQTLWTAVITKQDCTLIHVVCCCSQFTPSFVVMKVKCSASELIHLVLGHCFYQLNGSMMYCYNAGSFGLRTRMKINRRYYRSLGPESVMCSFRNEPDSCRHRWAGSMWPHLFNCSFPHADRKHRVNPQECHLYLLTEAAGIKQKKHRSQLY